MLQGKRCVCSDRAFIAGDFLAVALVASLSSGSPALADHIVVIIWSYAAFVAILSFFVVGPVVKSVLILAPVYLVFLSLKRSYEGAS